MVLEIKKKKTYRTRFTFAMNVSGMELQTLLSKKNK